jgi:hypothetical protein
LAALVGRVLETGWVAWDVDEECWFSIEPVVLRIGESQLDVALDLSMLWLDSDSIDVNAPVDASFDEDGYVVAWKQDGHPALDLARGRAVVGVYAIEFEAHFFAAEAAPGASPDGAWWLGGLGLELEGGGVLELVSNVDENFMSNQRSAGERVRLTRLAPG